MYQKNGVVSSAQFYNAGSPAAAKRYRYEFGGASYDALNRLKSADFSHYSSGWVTTAAHDLANITYDAAGNLTALQSYRETGTLIDNLTYSYPGSSNRLSSVADAINTTSETWDAEDGSFTYDANGNMKTAPAPYALSAVTYDHQNLPIALTKSGTTTTYRYDAGGMRISKQVGSGNTEVYLWDGSTTLGVFTVNGSGSLTSWHFNLLAGEQVIGRQPNTGNRRYYHTDLLGSTRAVVEGATIVESYDFEPWGLLMPGRTLGSGTKEGFTDKERDTETGLDYFGARYYMPALARWGAVDPLAEKHLEWTPYNYVLNNPLALIDPDGRQVWANGNGMRMAFGQNPGPLADAVVNTLGSPTTRDLVVGSTPGLSTFQDFAMLTSGVNVADLDQDVGLLDRGAALFGLTPWISGAQLRVGGRVLGRLGRDVAAEGGERVFRSFTKGNFRENLSRATGRHVADAHAHHVFPHKFRRQFSRLGIDVNDPRFGAWWEAGDHLSNARAYNTAWEQFLGTRPTIDQVMEFGKNLAAQYGLDISF
jgi:RHS repeat-associated protein